MTDKPIWGGWEEFAPPLPESSEFYRVTFIPITMPVPCVEDLPTRDAVRERIRLSEHLGQRIAKIERVIVSVETYEVDVDAIKAPPESELHVRRADGMDLCEYCDEDWPCAYVRSRTLPTMHVFTKAPESGTDDELDLG